MPNQRLIYRSRATRIGRRHDGLVDILGTSTRKNAGRQITGALALCDGVFVQVLEGRAGQLDRLMAVLGDDPRHETIEILGRWPISKRLFSGWPMAFANAAHALPDHPVRFRDGGGLELVGLLFGLAYQSPLAT